MVDGRSRGDRVWNSGWNKRRSDVMGGCEQVEVTRSDRPPGKGIAEGQEDVKRGIWKQA